MSVRHVYAKSGEYIAVHRHHGYAGTGSVGVSSIDCGCMAIVACVIGFWVIIAFWEFFLTVALICVAGWLIWHFRGFIWTCLGWLFGKCWLLACAGFRKIGAWYSQRKLSQPKSPVNGNHAIDPNYGKIIQHRH